MLTISFPGGDLPDVGGHKITLDTILMWITGSKRKPAEGFPSQPSIKVQHEDPERRPHVNTCACQLTLPANKTLMEMNVENIVEYMTFVIANSFFFGKE